MCTYCTDRCTIFSIFHDLMFEFDAKGTKELRSWCYGDNDNDADHDDDDYDDVPGDSEEEPYGLEEVRGLEEEPWTCAAQSLVVAPDRIILVFFFRLCFFSAGINFVFVFFVRAYFLFPYFCICVFCFCLFSLSIFLISEVLTAPGGRRSRQAWATRRGSRWTRWTSGCTEW